MPPAYAVFPDAVTLSHRLGQLLSPLRVRQHIDLWIVVHALSRRRTGEATDECSIIRVAFLHCVLCSELVQLPGGIRITANICRVQILLLFAVVRSVASLRCSINFGEILNIRVWVAEVVVATHLLEQGRVRLVLWGLTFSFELSCPISLF